METYVLTQENLGATLQTIRRKNFISQHYLARMFREQGHETSPSVLSGWEVGKGSPLTKNVIQYVNLLGYDVVLMPRSPKKDDDQPAVVQIELKDDHYAWICNTCGTGTDICLDCSVCLTCTGRHGDDCEWEDD